MSCHAVTTVTFFLAGHREDAVNSLLIGDTPLFISPRRYIVNKSMSELAGELFICLLLEASWQRSPAVCLAKGASG